MAYLKPLTKTTIKAEIAAAFRDAVAGDPVINQRDPERLKTVRASQLPFCALNFVLTAALAGTNGALGFHGSYFTSVGTAVHTVLQTFMGRGGKLLANWECHICGKHRKLSHESQCCEFESEYHELTINYKGVVGHVDGIFRAKDGRYWVIDFKTTSLSASAAKAINPGSAYCEQVDCYAWALKHQYGLDIAGVAVVFIIRDNPTTPVIWSEELQPEDFRDIGRRMKGYVASHKFAFNATTMADLRAMWKERPCKSLEEAADKAPFCPFANGCGSGDPTYAKMMFKRGIAIGHLPVKGLLNRKDDE